VYKQSSLNVSLSPGHDGPCLKCPWAQFILKLDASSIRGFHGFASTGGMKRSDFNGGSAYGMPRYLQKSGAQSPRTFPLVSVTTDGPVAKALKITANIIKTSSSINLPLLLSRIPN
jgi:hypothetical protein